MNNQNGGQANGKNQYHLVSQEPKLENNILENGKDNRSQATLEDAVTLTGVGKYNYFVLLTGCLLVLSMSVDIFGFSVVLPSAACDMQLTSGQQGFLSAVPLIGVMIASYWWGLCADTLGRRKTLLISMPFSVLLNFLSGLAPNYPLLATAKFLSACFSSSTNAAAYVWCGESTPVKHRSKFMFLMAGTTQLGQFFIGIFALPIYLLTFRVPIPFLSMEYRPWRLLMQINTIPGVIGLIGVLLMHESPKFLLSKGRQHETLEALRCMFVWNKGAKKENFPIKSVTLDDNLTPTYTEASFLRKLWNQTVPLFKRPLVKNSMKLYYLMFTAYMVTTGYTMWVPTMTNAYFVSSEDRSGQTFCQVANTAPTLTRPNGTNAEECDHVVKPFTLYAVMGYSGFCGVCNVLLTLIVGPLGKKRTTLVVYIITASSGILLLLVKIPALSIIFFCLFLYIGLILGNVNTYLMELNPTHLRGMATCLSVVVARGSGFVSVQLIGLLIRDHCTPTIAAYIVLIVSGLLVSLTLPPDNDKKKLQDPIINDADREMETINLKDKSEMS